MKDKYESSINSDDSNNNNTPYGREPELEAILGQINLTDFQSCRLRAKLSDKVAGYMHLGAGYYCKNKKGSNSLDFFQQNGKRYKISISVQEITDGKEF